MGDPAPPATARPASCTPPAIAGSRPASAGTRHSRPARPRGLPELPAAKVARAVLRGPERRNALRLPDHHDVELMDAAGRVLARKRLPEGVAGMARLHELIGQQLGEGADDAEVVIGIETDRDPWVAALAAAGYTVYAVNPLQASRYRERHGVSGAKSDRG